MKPIDVKRSTVTLDPDRTHVLARPFRLMSDQRSTKISARVMALPESEVHTLLAGVRAEFGDRQLKIDEFLRRRFDEVSPYLLNGQRLSEETEIIATRRLAAGEPSTSCTSPANYPDGHHRGVDVLLGCLGALPLLPVYRALCPLCQPARRARRS